MTGPSAEGERRGRQDEGAVAARYRKSVLGDETFSFRSSDAPPDRKRIQTDVYRKIGAELVLGLPPQLALSLREELLPLLFPEREVAPSQGDSGVLSAEQRSALAQVLSSVDERTPLTKADFVNEVLEGLVGGLPFFTALKVIAENRLVQTTLNRCPPQPELQGIFDGEPYFTDSFLPAHLAELEPTHLAQIFARLPQDLVDLYSFQDVFHSDRSRTLRHAYIRIIGERLDEQSLPLELNLPDGSSVQVEEVDIDIEYQPQIWRNQVLLHGAGEVGSSELMERPVCNAVFLFLGWTLTAGHLPTGSFVSRPDVGSEEGWVSLQPYLLGGGREQQREALESAMKAIGAESGARIRQRALRIPSPELKGASW
ncbi:hypothetical protein MRY87_12500 [bacterium]|nr:hypothetical protein [bacterium]